MIVTFSEGITFSPLVHYAEEKFDVPLHQFPKAVMDVTVDGNNDVLADDDFRSGNKLPLQLSVYVAMGQRVRVSYDNIFARNGGGILVDAAGNAVPYFSDKPVKNSSTWRSDVDRSPYSVTLSSQPQGDVSVNIADYQPVRASPQRLIFTPDNWNTPQTVSISALEATLAYYNSPENTDAQWYVFVATPDGEILGHYNAEEFGVHLQEMLVDGSFQASGEGNWVIHEDVNPATGEVSDKHFWLVEHDGVVFGSGWHHEGLGRWTAQQQLTARHQAW